MISAVRKLQGMSGMPPKDAAGRFFYITDLFGLTAKEWAQLLNELDSLTFEERYALFHGRDEETEYGLYGDLLAVYQEVEDRLNLEEYDGEAEKDKLKKIWDILDRATDELGDIRDITE